MAITYIEIDTNQLDQDVEALEVSIKNVRNIMTDMQNEFEELNSMWTGAANLAFRHQVASDMEALGNIVSEVDKLADCMERASKEYVKCENSVYELVQGISI